MHCLGKIAFFFRDNFHNIMNNTTLVNYFYLADGKLDGRLGSQLTLPGHKNDHICGQVAKFKWVGHKIRLICGRHKKKATNK